MKERLVDHCRPVSNRYRRRKRWPIEPGDEDVPAGLGHTTGFRERSHRVRKVEDSTDGDDGVERVVRNGQVFRVGAESVSVDGRSLTVAQLCVAMVDPHDGVRDSGDVFGGLPGATADVEDGVVPGQREPAEEVPLEVVRPERLGDDRPCAAGGNPYPTFVAAVLVPEAGTVRAGVASHGSPTIMNIYYGWLHR